MKKVKLNGFLNTSIPLILKNFEEFSSKLSSFNDFCIYTENEEIHSCFCEGFGYSRSLRASFYMLFLRCDEYFY